MRKLLTFIAAFMWGSVLWAATTFTDGPWRLVRSGTVQPGDYASPEACDAALRAQTVAVGSTVTFRCQRSTVARGVADAPPPPPPPPPAGDVRVTLSPSTYAVGGYSTIIWSGTGCTKSSSPAYSVWDGTPGDDGGRSVAPNVTTTFTLACANGTALATLTVTGSGPVDPPPGGGSGGNPPPPPTTLPAPTVLATPIQLPVSPLSAGDPANDYAHTARRDWNHGGHNVPVPFSQDQGYWDYENCTTHYADWLFDRPSSWFKFYELTGDVQFRDLAISDLRYYASHINASGYFDCKTGEADTKYLYVTPFLTYERLTGDQSLRPVAARLYAQSAQGFDVTYSPGAALWTERELGLHGEAALAYYELTGDTQALARAAAMIRQWSDVASGTGAPLVSYTQHEGGGPGGTQPTDLINSPWMSAFYFQFARRYWQVTGDQVVLEQASRYFDWLDANALYDGSLFHPEFTGVTVPRYLAPSLIGDGGYDEGNLLHCPDVMGLVAFAVDAKRRLGQSTTRAEQRLTELRSCTNRMWANWTRTTATLPRYRIQAPRAWNWWVRGLYEAAR